MTADLDATVRPYIDAQNACDGIVQMSKGRIKQATR